MRTAFLHRRGLFVALILLAYSAGTWLSLHVSLRVFHQSGDTVVRACVWIYLTSALALLALERRCTLGFGWSLFAFLAVLPCAFLFGWTSLHPRAETDVKVYAAYARKIAVHGLNPYLTHPPLRDREIDKLGPWPDQRVLYGPVALSAMTLPALLGARTLEDIVAGIKVVWLALLPLSMLLWWGVARSLGAPFPTALVFGYFGNPAVLFSLFAEAHTENLVLFLLPLWLLLSIRRQWALSAFAFALLAMVKPVTWVVFPLALYLSFENANAWRPRATFLLIVLYTVAIPYCLLQGCEFPAITAFIRSSSTALYSTIPNALFRMLGNAGMDLVAAQTRTSLLCNLLFFGALIFAAFQTRMKFADRSRALVAGTVLCFAALMLTRTYFWPWYVHWFALPFAALLRRPYLLVWAFVLFTLWFLEGMAGVSIARQSFEVAVSLFVVGGLGIRLFQRYPVTTAQAGQA